MSSTNPKPLLPLREVTEAELRAAQEEAEEAQQMIYEEFREIMEIPPEIWNMMWK